MFTNPPEKDPLSLLTPRWSSIEIWTPLESKKISFNPWLSVVI